MCFPAFDGLFIIHCEEYQCFATKLHHLTTKVGASKNHRWSTRPETFVLFSHRRPLPFNHSLCFATCSLGPNQVELTLNWILGKGSIPPIAEFFKCRIHWALARGVCFIEKWRDAVNAVTRLLSCSPNFQVAVIPLCTSMETNSPNLVVDCNQL